MKSHIFAIICIFLFFNSRVFSEDSSHIQYIKDEYKKISDQFLNKDNPLIATSESQGPLWSIMGIPRSKTMFYWESYRPDSSKPESDVNTGIRLRKSESYHGGLGDKDHYMTYNEFLFDGDGKVLFCYLKKGTGNISRTQKCKWEKEERYYFHNEKLIRVIKDGKTNDKPDGKAIKNGKAIVEQGKKIKLIAGNINSDFSYHIESD